jgi:hypothetical protein
VPLYDDQTTKKNRGNRKYPVIGITTSYLRCSTAPIAPNSDLKGAPLRLQFFFLSVQSAVLVLAGFGVRLREATQRVRSRFKIRCILPFLWDYSRVLTSLPLAPVQTLTIDAAGTVHVSKMKGLRIVYL